jgi:hypothetical protein
MQKNWLVIMQLKKLINFRFIALLCIAFIFQHFSFATQQKSIGFSNLPYGFTHNSYFKKGKTDHQYLQLQILVEAESEDEDEVHNEQIVNNELISSKQNFESTHYTDLISRLFLKLVSAHQHKVDLPFFILYHSWKSHLA